MTLSRTALARFGVIFVAWTAFGLLNAAQTQLQLNIRDETRPVWGVLGPALIGAWIWALYTPPLMRLARWLRHLRERWEFRWRGWAAFFGAHLAVAGVGTVADAWVWANVRPLIDGVTLPYDRVFAAVLLMNVFCYVAVVTLTEAGEYAARWRERDHAATSLARTADTLRRQLDDARLRALESQLRPHFLYNTLNLAAELVYDEPEVADEMLTHLGALLRRSYSESAQVVPLAEEMDFVRAYAGILARRYRDRVRLTITLPTEIEQVPVPAFLLQPLVENAFRHGVERRERGSAVDIEALARDGSLVVRVRDRGLARERSRGRRPERTIDAWDGSAEPAGDGIGLRNTRERLTLLYGSAAGLTLVASSSETVASVWLPAKLVADRAAAADSERTLPTPPATRRMEAR